MNNLLTQNELVIVISFLTALVITFLSIPTMVAVSKAKSLYAEINGRNCHKVNTPILGGVAIFTGFIISILLFVDVNILQNLQFIIAGLLLILVIGLKDDVLGISALVKLFGQIIAALIIIILGDIRLSNLHGFLGIHEIHYCYSVFLTTFVVIVIINCFNLIDGIDGLASGIAIICATTFGIWFYLIHEYEYTILTFALVGALIAFYGFNVFGKKNKIFMGDAGSLIVGFIIAIIAIKFNELNIDSSQKYAINSAPAVSIGILIIPLFDTLRVFSIRIFKRSSPFKADKVHLHHRLLTLGKSHFQISLIFYIINIFFIAFVFYFQFLGIVRLMLILTILAVFFTFLPILLINKRKNGECKGEGRTSPSSVTDVGRGSDGASGRVSD